VSCRRRVCGFINRYDWLREVAAVKVLGVVWVGTRTAAFEPTMDFFRDVLGIELKLVEPDFGWSRLPNTSQFEVFGSSDRQHPYFTTGPVPEFLVEDLAGAIGELRAAGVELLGEPVIRADGGWVHFRAPDGNVYGLTEAPTYRRPTG
jgi:predicted enzyme related to lactoylglutathione lyase